MNTIILVSCCAEKHHAPAMARDLYQSPLFKLARRYAEQTGHEWYILSALHHVVDPQSWVHPYDQRLSTKHKAMQEWGRWTSMQLIQKTNGEPTRFVSLCGQAYTRYLGMVERNHNGSKTGHVFEYPLDGMGVGQRLQWLKEQTEQQHGQADGVRRVHVPDVHAEASAYPRPFIGQAALF
jgi:hypothetical protein